MTDTERRARDARYKREQRARAKVAQIPHPTRAAETTLPPLSVLFDLLT